MRTAASFSSKWQKREENAHRNICPNYQSFICVTALKRTSGRAFVKYVCQLPLESAKWCTHAHICVWLPVYACVQIPMFDDNVSFTAGPLCLHWSLGAGWILPAALRKVTVWMTDGRAANIKETDTVRNHLSFDNCANKGHPSLNFPIFHHCTDVTIYSHFILRGTDTYAKMELLNIRDRAKFIWLTTWLRCSRDSNLRE